MKRPSKKLDHKKLGPFPVAEKVSTHTYRLGLPRAMNKIHNVFHVCLLEPTHPDPFPDRIQLPPPPVEIDSKLEYEIAEIVDSKIDRRRRGGGLVYCVCWTGYEHTNDEFSWLPAAKLANAQDVIMDFHRVHPNKPGHEVLDLTS
jgi:Chromo (CHRromatin Organisation MOdifier) domain